MAGAILVTGAKGFVGPHLMTRLSRDHPDRPLHAAEGDITNANAVAEEIRCLRPAICVHLAAISAPVQATQAPEQAWRVNLLGTLNLAQAIRAHAPDCLLLFASSAEVYGRSFLAGVPLDEGAVLAPLNTYAATKAATDLALGALAAEGLRCVRLRAFNHTGPGQSDAFVVAAFARQVALIASGRQSPVLRVGALDAARDFLDVRDVCAAYSACIAHAHEIPAGAILNIASGTPRKIGDVLRALLDAANVQAAAETDPARLRGNEIPLACGDASRACSLLQWTPKIPWEQTISDVLDDWRRRTQSA